MKQFEDILENYCNFIITITHNKNEKNIYLKDDCTWIVFGLHYPLLK